MELRNRRKLVNVSQKELAEKVNVTNDYISQLERNNRTPSLSLAKSISDYLTEKAIEKKIPKELFTIDNIFFIK